MCFDSMPAQHPIEVEQRFTCVDPLAELGQRDQRQNSTPIYSGINPSKLQWSYAGFTLVAENRFDPICLFLSLVT